MGQPYDLASLTALTSFEAAARHRSFKNAAHEINVTPAAVSHQIKLLEQDLGCALFTRRHRGVELTEKGAYLLVALQRGFEGISAAITQLRDQPNSVDVRLRVTTAVSALWLTPKITAFWKAHPMVTVSQVVSDVPADDDRQDLTIGYMDADEGPQTHALFHDRILAVGSPGFAAEQRITGLDDLRRVPLIHATDDHNRWTDWTDWFAALGAAPPQGRKFIVNNHMIALQAAQDDIGAVLAWEGLMGSILPQRRLIRLVPDEVASSVPFAIRVHPRASRQARLFMTWLIANSGPQA